MLKIRRPLGRLIFNMGIAIPGKTVFLIETAPWLPVDSPNKWPEMQNFDILFVVNLNKLLNKQSYHTHMTSLSSINICLHLLDDMHFNVFNKFNALVILYLLVQSIRGHTNKLWNIYLWGMFRQVRHLALNLSMVYCGDSGIACIRNDATCQQSCLMNCFLHPITIWPILSTITTRKDIIKTHHS